MENLNIILPSLLLLIGVLLKLFIARPLAKKTLGEASCELPVDLIFLAISFTIGYTATVGDFESQSTGFVYAIAGIAIAVLVVVLWRLSLDLFYKKGRKVWFVIILAINLAISGFCIHKSIQLVNQSQMEIINNYFNDQAFNLPETC
ncbi:MAG: hypothetical protein Aureis2KO_05630 [Aureisphaera sp.]